MCGSEADEQRKIPQKEMEYVHSVSRGMYALRPIKKGEILNTENLDEAFELAIPIQPGQYSAHDLNDDIVAKEDYQPGDPIKQ